MRHLRPFFRALAVPYLLAFALFVPYQLAVHGLGGYTEVMAIAAEWFMLLMPLAALWAGIATTAQGLRRESPRRTLATVVSGGAALVAITLLVATVVLPAVMRPAATAGLRRTSAYELTPGLVQRNLMLRERTVATVEGRLPLPSSPISFVNEPEGRRAVTRLDQAGSARMWTEDILRPFSWIVLPLVAALLGWVAAFWLARIPDPRVRTAHLAVLLTLAALALLAQPRFFDWRGTILGFETTIYAWPAVVLDVVPWHFVLAPALLLWPTWILLRYPAPLVVRHPDEPTQVMEALAR